MLTEDGDRFVLLQQEAEVAAHRKQLQNAKVLNGPCERSVEAALQRHGIQRQAYHGGAFVGNHVHKALKRDVIVAVTSAASELVRERCPALQPDADRIAERYRTLMQQYASCSELFSSSSAVSDEAISELERHITTFMATARREVVSRRVGNVTPKLHLLEDHVVPFMQRFGVGLGVLGEQGGEGIHHEMNELMRSVASIRNELTRLETVVRNHCIATLPQQLVHTPQAPTRRTRARHTLQL